MAFPSDINDFKPLRAAVTIAAELKANVRNYKARYTNGIDADDLIDVLNQLKKSRDSFVSIRGQLRLIGSAQGSLAKDFQELTDAIDAANSWAVKNLPESGGWLQLVRIRNAKVEYRSFTAQQIAPFISRLDNILAEIA